MYLLIDDAEVLDHIAIIIIVSCLLSIQLQYARPMSCCMMQPWLLLTGDAVNQPAQQCSAVHHLDTATL